MVGFRCLIFQCDYELFVSHNPQGRTTPSELYNSSGDHMDTAVDCLGYPIACPATGQERFRNTNTETIKAIQDKIAFEGWSL